jgi:hypothetical protein
MAKQLADQVFSAALRLSGNSFSASLDPYGFVPLD